VIRVSVLIASHRKELLPRAIASVAAQTLPASEIQLLVNASADPSLFRTNWNELASIAKGTFLVILGDDDTLEPGYLAHACHALESTRGDIAYSDVAIRDGSGNFWDLYRPPGSITLETMRQGNKIWQSSLVRRSIWEAVSGYDMGVPYAHDYDFWVRALKAGASTTYVPMIGWNYYVHSSGRVTDNTDHDANWRIFDAKHPDFRVSPG